LELHDALIGAGKSGDAATVFEDQARLFMEGVIRLTPPTRQRGMNADGVIASTGGAKQTGEKAIERDLKKIFTGVHEDMVDDFAIEHGTNNIDTWFTGKGGKKINAVWDRIDNTGQGMANFHKANRNSLGRTYSLKKNGARGKGDAWYAAYVVTLSDYKNYADKVKSRLGRRKAAWGKSLLSVGGTLPNWISKHVSGARGAVQNNLHIASSPSITMTNFAPGIGEDRRIVNSQMRIRMSAIKRNMKGVISGYADDWKNGLRIKKQAKRTTPALTE